MDNLTPTARATLDALRNGVGNVHELRERTGRSRSATDKALAELAKAGLIVKVDSVGDAADGAPTRWQLAGAVEAGKPGDGHEPEQADSPAEPAEADLAVPVDVMAPETADSHLAEPADGETVEANRAVPSADAHHEAGAAEQPNPHEVAAAPDTDPTDGAPPATSDQQPDSNQQPDSESEPATAEQEQPKLCRGCQAQMPKICEHCWQKTPAYCGKCRKDMPQVRRGEPGEPAILSNGLPKLRPGELEQLVLKVMRENPMPHHVGVTGWTSGRVAIFLPGRSTGAIGNALDKLVKTGVAQLIGDRPMRYQLTPTEQPDSDGAQAAETTEPADAAGEPATPTD